MKNTEKSVRTIVSILAAAAGLLFLHLSEEMTLPAPLAAVSGALSEFAVLHVLLHIALIVLPFFHLDGLPRLHDRLHSFVHGKVRREKA